MVKQFIGFLRSPFHNAVLKLVALLLAIFSWYGIKGVLSHETELSEIPINVRINEDWAITDLSSKIVTLYFTGAQSDLMQLNKDNVSVSIDLRNTETVGERWVNLGPENIVAPRNVRLELIQPARIFVDLDERISMQLPVKIEMSGVIPEGYEVQRYAAEPAVARISGPKSEVESLSYVSTKNLDMGGRRKSFREWIELSLPGALNDVSFEPERVAVEVVIREHTADRHFADVPLRVLREGDRVADIELSPQTVILKLQGRKEHLDALEPAMLRAYIDCVGLAENTRYELPIQLDLPSGVQGSAEPSSVSVQINRTKMVL